MALVLSRKEEESICIGDEIKVTVIEIRENKVRLAITCPREIPVHREEIYREIKAENADQDAHRREMLRRATP